jgi:hypothetical protein
MSIKMPINIILGMIFFTAVISTPRPVVEQEVKDFNYPDNVPSWNGQYAKDFPMCEKEKALADNLLVITQGNDPVIMPFDKVWEVAKDDNRANDVWVIGDC